jgi:hypothetical protein
LSGAEAAELSLLSVLDPAPDCAIAAVPNAMEMAKTRTSILRI